MANDNTNSAQQSNAFASTYGKILKYTGIFGSVQVLQVLMSVIRNKCAAIFIGRIGMGITDVLNRTTDMFSALTNLGIPISGVRAISAEHADAQRLRMFIGTVRLWSVMLGILGAAVCALLSAPINKYFFAGNIPNNFLAYVSPVILCMSIYGGEVAILKGTRNIKQLASVSAIATFLSLVITVLLYILFGINGIPWALLAGSAILASSAFVVTHRLYPWSRGIFSRVHLVAGRALLAIGVSYVVAGFAGTGAEMLVRMFISQSSMGDVGLYASGFVLCVTYTRIVFVAMDADYFPRLSAVGNDCSERNQVVSKQIDVCVLLMAPMLITLLMFLPLVISLLYSSEFKGAIGMCIGATGYLFVKAIIAPIEYIPLAKGDSMTYLIMELAYDLFFVIAVVVGYKFYKLDGAGMALTVSYVFDLVMVGVVYKRIYNFSVSRSSLRIIIVQGGMVAVAFFTFVSGYGLVQYILGAILIAFSVWYSVKKLNLSWKSINQMLRKKKVGK